MADNENKDLSQVDSTQPNDNDENTETKSRTKRHLIDAPSDDAVYDANGEYVKTFN